MNKLLVVEDEVITSDLLKRYFQIVGYDVINALTGEDAVRIAEEEKPVVIILDIMLPDMDGYEVCKKLRSNKKTDTIPIIFLTARGDRRDRLDGLELGVDDYITKPFDVEELRLRVHNIINRLGTAPLVDARTSLPNTDLIRERLPDLLREPDMAFLNVQVEELRQFSKRYGPVAANQVIRGVAKHIGDLLRQAAPKQSFIGHPSDDHFLIATTSAAARRVEEDLPQRFADRAKNYYDYADQEKGQMKVEGGWVPFMRLVIKPLKREKLEKLIQEYPSGPLPASASHVFTVNADEKKPPENKPPLTLVKPPDTSSGDSKTEPGQKPSEEPEADPTL